LLLTSDEEGDAKYGTVEILKYLKERNELPDYCIVAEPTCDMRFGDTIKVGRRGSINGVLHLQGVQGHAAYPEKSKNPIHEIAGVLHKIAGVDLDGGDDVFAPSKFVITDIRAGMEMTNVTPGSLKMMFNVRNSTKTTKADVEAFVQRHFAGMAYTLTLTQGAKPFVTERNSPVVALLCEAVREVTGINPGLGTGGGTSDARFLGEYGVDTVEFGVINDTIHAPNERTSINELRQLEAVFVRLLASFHRADS
jgi:succinyl-diaminopimelate desuccinylase